MEKYTRNARFCLICNYVSKIIPALQVKRMTGTEWKIGASPVCCCGRRWHGSKGLELQLRPACPS